MSNLKLEPRANHWAHYCRPYNAVMETAQDVCPVCRTGKGETAQALRDVAKVVTDAMIEYGEISRAQASGVQAHIAKRIVETFGPLEPTR